MLGGIKALINDKISLQESASLILEGNTGIDLDDAIVLGEDGSSDDSFDENSPEIEDENESEDTHNEGDTSGGDPGTIPGEEEGPTGDNTPSEGNGDPATDDSIGQDIDNTDMMDVQIDDLPTPVGAQTGEPIKDDIDDIMHMEIDLRSNTMSDALPVPPSNAGEAIATDDIGTQRVDSGFGGSDNNSPVEAPSTDSSNSPNDAQPTEDSNIDESAVMEGISLAGGMEDNTEGGNSGNTDSTGDPAPADDSSDSAAEQSTENDGENSVTSAVRDKVNETESIPDTATPSTGGASKEDLLKKLGSITKNLEDAKKAIMDSIT